MDFFKDLWQHFSMGKKDRNLRKPPRRKKSVVAVQTVEDAERMRRRLARLKPRRFDSELDVDAAIYDESVLKTLPPELAEQVNQVKSSLKLVYDGFGEEANRQMGGISRSSPLSQWRLFIRGLVDWYDGHLQSATDCWRRLDAERRPWRIAEVLSMSLSEQIDSLTDVDITLRSAAKRVRELRIDRPALIEAARETAIPERRPLDVDAEEFKIGSRKLRWLQDFSTDYRLLEPKLVAALEQNALLCVSEQPLVDVFDQATKSFPGPPHDPQHLLFKANYIDNFDGQSEQVKTLFSNYLEKDLPRNTRISPQLRDAILCVLSLDKALAAIAPKAPNKYLAQALTQFEDSKQIDYYFQKAIQAYPSAREAHRAYTQWLGRDLNNDDLKKAERTKAEVRVAEAMEAWCDGDSGTIEPRLWLVDYYLESEELEKSKQHVDWLKQSRHADPRVRATPWKWEMLEAMRLSRRKAWTAKAAERLDHAEQCWPPWLSRDWLPYLRAALTLRQGDTDGFQKQHDAIRQQATADAAKPFSSLADALMMLAAAQRMRVPSNDLKPLRVPVDDAVKKRSSLSLFELVRAGAFLWDLHRTSLVYPAYRSHGSKLASELADSLHRMDELESKFTDIPGCWNALYWLSECRFGGGSGDRLPIPGVLAKERHRPECLAAMLNAAVKSTNATRELKVLLTEGDELREAATQQQDSYLRYWFDQLVTDAEEKAAHLRRAYDFPAPDELTAFAEMMRRRFDLGGFDDEDDEYEDEDDDRGFDPDCDCPHCTAARAAYQRRMGFETEDDLLFGNELDEEDDYEDDYDDYPGGFVLPPEQAPQPIPVRQRIDAQPDPDFIRNRPKNPMSKKKKKSKR